MSQLERAFIIAHQALQIAETEGVDAALLWKLSQA